MRTLAFQKYGSAVTLPRIVLGAAQFGSGVTAAESCAIMDAYVRQGGTALDTARVYGEWSGAPYSERVIGEWMRVTGLRDTLRIITKGCHPMIDAMHIPRVGAAYIREDVERSLECLGIDAIDVYYLHRDNPSVEVGEIIETLNEYIKGGNIRSIGASNWTVERIAEANAYAEAHKLCGFESSQVHTALARMNDGASSSGLIPMSCTDKTYYIENGIPVLAWGGIGGGIIMKRVGGEPVSEATDKRYGNDDTYARAERVRALCAELDITPTQACIAYLTCNALPMCAVVGTKSVAQTVELMSAADTVITPNQADALEGV